MGLPNVPDWKPSLVITAIPVGGRCVFLDLQVYMHIRSKPTRTDMFWWFVQGLLQVNHYIYIYKHMYHCFLVWKNLSISREKTRGKRLPPQRLPCPKVHDRKGHNLGLGERRGRDGPGQGGSRSPGDVGRVGFNRNARERRCFFGKNPGMMSWFFWGWYPGNHIEPHHESFQTEVFLNGRFDNLQDTEEQMDKFYVTRFLLALRLEQCSLERLSFPKYLQTFCPVSAQNWNICPLLLYIISSWITLCVCVLHFGSFPANIFFMFLFHAHVTPVFKMHS